MALMHVLKEEGFEDVVACHLNHGLRGGESDGDEEFVRRMGREAGYKVEAGGVDVRRLMEESGESLETAARGARHEFFGGCGRKYGCGRLLLGHHLNDQAETVLWNLARGSRGVRGMKEVTKIRMGGVEMEVYRPFLGIAKRELEEWMRAKGKVWREDASNGECDVVRNRMRHEVLPLLGEISKRDVSVVLGRAARAGEDFREIVEWAVGRAGVKDPQGRLHAGVLKALPRALREAVIGAYLEEGGVPGMTGGLVEKAGGMLEDGAAAVVNLPGGGRLRRKQGRLFIEGR